jgi:2-aminoadipate transaminase
MSENIIRFTRGIPPPESFPTNELAECSAAILANDEKNVLQYGNAGGYPPLRSLLAKNAGVKESRIAIGQGSLQFSDTLSRIFIKSGDLVYFEAPSYDRVINIFERSGAVLKGIPLTQAGLDIEDLSFRLMHGERPVLFYIIPDFQNPSGTVLSLEKRIILTELAEKYGFWIVEDNPYRKLRYRGDEIPSLFELNPDRVIHMSSFSKLISPGLRVGYLILPETLASKFLNFSEDTYISASYLTQGIIYEFIQKGFFERNLALLKSLYEPKLDIMLDALDHEMTGFGYWNKPDGGFFIGLTLETNLEMDRLILRSQQAGVFLSDGRGFFCEPTQKCFIRLPFCALSSEEIRMGVHRLGNVVRELLQAY